MKVRDPHVAGLDLSTSRIGYVAPDGSVQSIRARTGPEDPIRRLVELREGLRRSIALHPPKPDVVVIEDYSLAGPGIIAKIRLGEVGGVARAVLFDLGVAVVERRPSNLKRFATGKGDASKEEMIAAAIRDGAPGSVNHDEADAWHARRMGRVAFGVDPANGDHQVDAISVGTW